MTERNKKINELANVNIKIAKLIKDLDGYRGEAAFLVAKLQTALEFEQQLLSEVAVSDKTNKY